MAFAFVSSLHALSHGQVREPVVKFIDFYIATQDADAPPMSFLERVAYGLVLSRDRSPQDSRRAEALPDQNGRTSEDLEFGLACSEI